MTSSLIPVSQVSGPSYIMGMSTVKNTAARPRKPKPKGRHPYQALSTALVRTTRVNGRVGWPGFTQPFVRIGTS